MDLRHFRYFVGVAEELSFSRAAIRLHVSQPPLTQAIHHLESELNVRLFNRTSRKVELSEAGASFLTRARSILAQVDRTAVDLRLQAEGKKVVLRVGFARPIGILPDAMKTFRKRFPEVHLELMPSVNRSGREFLLDDEADVNIGAYLAPDEQLNSRLWAELRLAAVVPISHHLAKRPIISLRDLRDDSILLPGPNNLMRLGREALQFCRDVGRFEPKLLRYCDDPQVLLFLIASDAGVGMTHILALTHELQIVKYVPFRERSPALKVGIAWRRDREGPVLLGLVDALEAQLRQTAKDIPGLVYFRRDLLMKRGGKKAAASRR